MSIHETAEDGREEELLKLLQRNIQAVNEEDEYGETPLHLACMAGHTNCVKALINNGASLDRQNRNGTTSLHYAARYGRQGCVGLLLRNGANVMRKDNEHWTPLHYAAINAQTECASLLMDKGADPNALTLDHNTPLHLAAAAGVLDCVILLIKYGAKLNIKNNEGSTPLSLLPIKAKENGDLRERNSLKQLSNDLRGLVNDRTYADTVFAFDDAERKTLYGCRAIISRRCTRLEGIIQQQRSTTNSGSNDPAVLPIVRVQGVSAAIFENLLHFLYTGEVPALAALGAVWSTTGGSEQNKVKELASLVELMRLGELYQCAPLTDYCEEAALTSLNVDSAIDLLSLTDPRKKGASGRNWGHLLGAGYDELSRQCLLRVRKTIGRYLIEHFNEAAEAKALRRLRKESIAELVQELPVEVKHKPAEYVRRAERSSTGSVADPIKGGLLMADCLKIVETLMADPDAWPFNQPVDPVALGLPQYFDIIKEPMDFGTIREKLKKDEYTGISQFERDMHLVFANALLFNEPNSDIGYWAKKLRTLFEKKLAQLKERRERRTPAASQAAPVSQKEPASSAPTSSSPPPASSSPSSHSVNSAPPPSSSKKKHTRPSAPVAPSVSPQKVELAREKLSQERLNQLTPHQLMEVLAMVQASSMPAGDEGDSNEEIVIDLKLLPPDTLVRIHAYVESCLDPGDDKSSKRPGTDEERTTTGGKSVESRKRPRGDSGGNAAPVGAGGAIGGHLEHIKDENGKAVRREKPRSVDRRKEKVERGADSGELKKRKKRHHSLAVAGTAAEASNGASAQQQQQHRKKERKRVKSEREEPCGASREQGMSGYAATSFEHIEFGHS